MRNSQAHIFLYYIFLFRFCRQENVVEENKRRGSSLRQATPERNIVAILDIRPQASSVVDSSQIESLSSHHFYQSVFCSHLVIARLAGENYKAIEKIYSDESAPLEALTCGPV
jgi:hypothetical protein